MTALYSGKTIEGTHVFTGERSARGYRINKLAASLAKDENRCAFLADESGYLDRFGLDADHKDMIGRRDWAAIIEAGGNIYLILKIAATVGSNLIAMGAQMRGESVAEFMRTRRGAAAPVRRE